ncbi:MAG: Hsp20/alpha crystallin family protein [Nitrososphaeria archaeon]
MYRRKRSIFDMFEELRKQMDEFLQESFETYLEYPMHDVERGELQPLTQITETEDEVIVVVDLPFVSKNTINTYATEDSLRIEASTIRSIRIEPWGSMRKEVEFDKFRKTIRLPVAVRPKEAKARFKNGILEVRFPKKIAGSRIDIE